MGKPTLTTIDPGTDYLGGGELAWIVGTGFRPQVAVFFGDQPALEVLAVLQAGDDCWAHVRTPSHPEGTVDVVLHNLDEAGAPVPGESATLEAAFRFVRRPLTQESRLTRLVRSLLQQIKRHVIENVSLRVALDYDDSVEDGTRVVAMAKIPSMVLSGPRVRQNRFYSNNQAVEQVVSTPSGEPAILRRAPSLTVDLGFTLTGASDRSVELLNLMAATTTFLNRNRWVAMPQDPAHPEAGTLRWELDLDGEFRTALDGPDGVGAFTCDLAVRGFDLDDGAALDVTRPVEHLELETEAINGE